ncbi:NAD-dependent epimerase/dehydratase family protein [Lichenihabitans sp. Uapishka_5]|uniref:NAD-dependent epimerase/dehydratase family protein n=1 Tax=Lichenihabitans sp. Uapishka_5 TaxID=3037302 RepID=UPI0029E7FDF8|nr:NAD-dependent epimerase/dehydratase family protein [Lichenihabitans sp. Uapishka_5]MDX7951177.1 NAD-dependent epimerase/dehydratase family protein [Lichenihabitans sp. Uapishka_5]
MARVVLIGGSGHIGTYLVPRLVEAGHHVVNVTRGRRAPYLPHRAWQAVETVTADREAEDRDGRFSARIAGLAPDIVVDLVCFTLPSAQALVEALQGRVQQFIHIGTIWVHGPASVVPTPEEAPRRPFGAYGEQKAAIEASLLDRARRDGFPATIIHPGHIVGPGWAPLNPAGHFNPEVFAAIARGEVLTLPNFGLETVHHVHADDVAQMVMRAIGHWGVATGEAFHAVSSGALTLRGYAEAMFRWFGHEPRLAFLPWDAWAAGQDAAEAHTTYEHIARSPNCSIRKAERLLGYAPRFTSLEAVQEAVVALGLAEHAPPAA